MATEAVWRKLLGLIVFFVEKDLRVSCRVAAALPISEALRMALATRLLQAQYHIFRESDVFIWRASKVLHDAVDV